MTSLGSAGIDARADGAQRLRDDVADTLTAEGHAYVCGSAITQAQGVHTVALPKARTFTDVHHRHRVSTHVRLHTGYLQGMYVCVYVLRSFVASDVLPTSALCALARSRWRRRRVHVLARAESLGMRNKVRTYRGVSVPNSAHDLVGSVARRRQDTASARVSLSHDAPQSTPHEAPGQTSPPSRHPTHGFVRETERALVVDKDSLLERSKQRESELEEEITALQTDIATLDSQLARAMRLQKESEDKLSCSALVMGEYSFVLLTFLGINLSSSFLSPAFFESASIIYECIGSHSLISAITDRPRCAWCCLQPQGPEAWTQQLRRTSLVKCYDPRE